ncbi:PKS-KS domain-containing protein [Sulfidibacter corallicola]|uniref:Ketosynthase family 3 (KS3) domain-containing protein n=1 Tax=Sulfidibacter corallicola TaxID=2818388 RepID=A0A8A4TNW5_SULCO|nr:beta-ketoacyl synthase N-terminal-like domain-containing protein [Sulfidibacter corallicola]QTD51666.1 hypothetical protein J3U87_04280 [Sulfidibacter corallicola]
MNSTRQDRPVVTGIGISTAVGMGIPAFTAALLRGDHAFGIMARDGRQRGETRFIGAELPDFDMPDDLSRKLWRTATLSGKTALITLREAWRDARLDEIGPDRIGLVIGGSNVQQRELVLTQTAYADRLAFLRPTYALNFLDSDICGLCTQQFGIRGFAQTVGGASASGQLAIIRAAEAVASGLVDACIAVGALMDCSYFECAGFRALGAMGSERFANDPDRACRPFDRLRDGFIYGEACGVVVIERAASAEARGVRPHAHLAGWAVTMDANRNPDPSFDGELRVIRQALEGARLAPSDIDYVNPHGTGSTIGDETELAALTTAGLGHAPLNTTKSVTGHGLTAAGAVEVIATLVQMDAGRLHPCRNLEDPIRPDLAWVRDGARPHDMRHALSLSMGFGGINTALVMRHAEAGAR